MSDRTCNRRPGGFTLVEVLVALVIVAFGFGALLSALTNSAANLAALREKSLAEWIALDQISLARLSLQEPATGVIEGEVTNFADGNWHYQEVVTPFPLVPGVRAIVVRVRRSDKPWSPSAACTNNPPAAAPGGSGTGDTSAGGNAPPPGTGGGASAALPEVGSTGTLGSAPAGGLGVTGTLGAHTAGGGSMPSQCLVATKVTSTSQFVPSDVTAGLGLGAGSALGQDTPPSTAGGASGSSASNQAWITTVVGFRGDAIAAANGEDANWAFAGSLGGGGSSGSSGSSAGAASGGATIGPGAIGAGAP